MFWAEPARRRPPLHPATRLRSMDVARGRSGYGFTLCGHAPCLLGSILKGSPAHYVGLRPGDQILRVNEVDVARASREDVVKLIGRCSGVLRLVIAEGSAHRDSCSSDEEFGPPEARGPWLKPRVDSKTLGISRAERVVAEMQSGSIFNMIFDSSSHSSGSLERAAPAPLPRPRPLSEPHPPSRSTSCSSRSTSDLLTPDLLTPDPLTPDLPTPDPLTPDLLSEEEMSRVLCEDAEFAGAFEDPGDLALDAGELDVGMMVGYLGSVELACGGAGLEGDSLQAIRGCMRRLRAEQRVHALVMMKVTRDSVQLWSESAALLACYPAHRLAFSAMCPDDRRFFGLVTMATAEEAGLGEEAGLRSSCHVFLVDPELSPHGAHQGVARRFGFACTPDPDTGGCLEFPPAAPPLLQFVSVLYRDMGESIEGVRARAFPDGDLDAQQNTSTSSNSDSGIGNFLPEDRGSRVLLVDLGGSGRPPPGAPGVPGGPWENTQPWNSVTLRNGFRYEQEGKFHLSELPPPAASSRPLPLGPSARLEVPPRPPHRPGGNAAGVRGSAQGWLPMHVLQDWRHGNASDQESYAESTDGWSSANCSTLPPPMSKIPADRYRAPGEMAPPPRGRTQRDEWPPRGQTQREEWAPTLFSTDQTFRAPQNGKRSKDREKKVSRIGGVALGFSLSHRSSRRSKRRSLARSLDQLESAAVSDGELHSSELKGCGSENSLSSNASLPSVHGHRRPPDSRVARWAVCFERLLQDPVAVRYFSEFLKKEFSEENILFWQACEYFSHVPENDKKQLSQRAREIYSSFLSSKATTPVNIDSQAQLADDILNAPRPDMFKEQQLQIFNLMKFDSYSRFLKSSLYQECMLAEVEGRPLPEPHRIPGSPASSKHSVSSERSSVSTPKKDGRKARPGRSLNEDCRDEHVEKKKGIFFSWSRNRSFGKGPKKRDFGDLNYDFADRNGRRESQGSLSSGASMELGVSGPGGRGEGEARPAASEREKGRSCNINLPDGSCRPVAIRPGVSIRELLLGLCQTLRINLAAVDLFLVGGEKPLVLDQDCVTLSSRDLRLEKRTLFRLDLVPINRSVGLKAKPTKPVTEVLRPVVAKYGLQLGHLVAKISGEAEPLDLGLPISSLDGLRVILDTADHAPGKEKQKLLSSKSHAPPLSSRSHSTTGDETPSARGRPARGLPDPRLRPEEPVDKRKQKKINIEEAEEFFDLISKAQGHRADDQRGLLNKEDLVLPDFLRPGPDFLRPGAEPACSTPGPRGGTEPHRAALKASHASQSLDSAPSCPPPPRRRPLLPPGRQPHPLDHAPFSSTLSPIPHAPDGPPQESAAELTLLGEGPISTLPPPAGLTPPDPPCSGAADGSSRGRGGGAVSLGLREEAESPQRAGRVIDVDGVRLEDGARPEGPAREGDPELGPSVEGYASELRQCQGRMRTAERPPLHAPPPSAATATRHPAGKATFV